MKKRFISLIMLIIVVVSFETSALANFDADQVPVVDFKRINTIEQNARGFLDAEGYDELQLENHILMYDSNNEIAAIYYPLSPDGFLIASYKKGTLLIFLPIMA